MPSGHALAATLSCVQLFARCAFLYLYASQIKHDRDCYRFRPIQTSLYSSSRDLTRRLEAGAELSRLQARRADLKKEAQEASHTTAINPSSYILLATGVQHSFKVLLIVQS